MLTVLLLGAVLAPASAALVTLVFGWRRGTALAGVAAPLLALVSGALLAAREGSGHEVGAGGLLRGDALSAVMLIIIGSVGTVACWASIGYLEGDAVPAGDGAAAARAARHYGVLVQIFITAMVLAVLADNLGVTWVAIEATTVATALLVGHRRTRESLEASWKYVVVCTVGISVAFLGTVLLNLADRHAGASSASALRIDDLLTHAPQLDHGVTKLAFALLLIGYGTKAGLAPFHTWLADAHSQAPAPVSALMSGVLLAVAFSVLLRLKVIADAALGPGFLRTGLLVVGLLTLLVAAGMLVVQRDYKRMLAYSSLENMGLVAVAAAAGTPLAIGGALLHLLAHGHGKSVLFVTAGEVQHDLDSTLIDRARGLISRAPELGAVFALGLVALLGLPPFALFASELSIARGVLDAHLTWALVVALLFVLVSSASLVAHGSRLLLGGPAEGPAPPARPRARLAPVLLASGASLALGLTGTPVTHLLTSAAAALGRPGGLVP
jgi:hydrogenase-4 component F